MADTKRCIYCNQILRADGYCTNPNCIDYLWTRIYDDEQERLKEAKEKEEIK